MLILRAAEQIDQRAQDRKDRGLATAHLLRKALRGLCDFTAQSVLADLAETNRRQARNSLGNRREQYAAAGVQRIDRKAPPARGKGQRRIDKPHIPAGVAARKLEARRKQNAAAMIERFSQRVVGRLIKTFADLSGYADAAFGGVTRALHADLLCAGVASGDPGRFASNYKGRPELRNGLYRKCQTTAAGVRRATTKSVTERAKS